MYNCHEDMLSFHDEEVTLPETERAEMRERRNTNRERLKAGLKRDSEPSPKEHRSQGSYAMRTMVQIFGKDYDIDDGVYFDKELLKGPRDADKSAYDAKVMVRKALDDEHFKKRPKIKTNCVRVYYDAGYRVDVPVYRRITDADDQGRESIRYELASADWKPSDPSAVTAWFMEENRTQSPDEINGRQLRRITRMLKKYARSRSSWKARTATGFMITKLVVEKYQANLEREDTSLYDTMVSICDRLNADLEIEHPTVKGEKLTNGTNDARSRFLRDRLSEAIEDLDILFDPACTQEDALTAWDKVFNDDFFRSRVSEHDESEDTKSEASSDESTIAAIALIKSGSDEEIPQSPVDKQGGGRSA